MLLESYNIALACQTYPGCRRVAQQSPPVPGGQRCQQPRRPVSTRRLRFQQCHDGWWKEGFNGQNGWAIGTGAIHTDEHYQDNVDSDSMYETLENIIVPLYTRRDEKRHPRGLGQDDEGSIMSLAAYFKHSPDAAGLHHGKLRPCPRWRTSATSRPAAAWTARC